MQQVLGMFAESDELIDEFKNMFEARRVRVYWMCHWDSRALYTTQQIMHTNCAVCNRTVRKNKCTGHVEFQPCACMQNRALFQIMSIWHNLHILNIRTIDITHSYSAHNCRTLQIYANSNPEQLRNNYNKTLTQRYEWITFKKMRNRMTNT